MHRSWVEGVHLPGRSRLQRLRWKIVTSLPEDSEKTGKGKATASENTEEGRRAGKGWPERIQKRRSWKEKARASLISDPFRYAQDLLEEKKSGKLTSMVQELESYVKEQLGKATERSPLTHQGMCHGLHSPHSSSILHHPSGQRSNRW